MSLSSRGARAAARSLRQPGRIRPTQRHASHGADHGHGNGHGESALHADAGIKHGGEGFGKGFYITLALIPITYLAYITATAKQNPFEQFIDQYLLKASVETEKNAIHSRMMERALADRSLFKESVTDFAGPAIRYPEGLNHGSPFNVVAGQGSADMNKLMQHITEENKLRDAERPGGRRILEEGSRKDIP